jgi:hypothetical protein
VRYTRRLVPITVLAAALAAGTAACGSSGSSGSSGPAADPLAGLTSKQIATKAVTGTKTANAVRISGSGENAGSAITLDLTVVKDKGCQGSFSEGSQGSFKLVYDGTTVWMLPDATFYKKNNVPASAVALLNGKYIKVKATTAGMGSMAQLCSLSGLLGSVNKDASLSKGVKTTYNGQPAIKITDNTGTGVAYVSDTATPVLLRINKPGSDGGQLNFTYSGIATTITPPPASQTIDGSKYGF